MTEVKEKIVEQAGALFMRLGIRSVTMEDVAREVSMSKKTIYQFFENKNDLVQEVAKMRLTEELSEFSQIAKSAINAIHEIFQISGCLRKNIGNMNPTTLHDLKRYHPVAYQQFTEFKDGFIRGNIEDNLKRGINEGYYREDIDTEVISIFRVQQVEQLFDQSIYPSEKFEFAHVQMQIMDHFIYGIVTDKGRELYLELKSTEEVN